jgi:ribonuclease-3
MTMGSEPAERDNRFVGLEAELGWDFHDPQMLRRALVHRSYCAEHRGESSNERLEFLGDAILGVAVTDFIFRNFPELPEGELAKVRAAVVSAEALAEVAARIGLGEFVLLGKGETASGGRSKPSILADAMEAVIAAVYLDGGLEPATALVLRVLEDEIVTAAAGPGGQDFKTRLQEETTRRLERMPRYQVRDEGPDHAKQFYATVTVDGVVRGMGEGRSKKQAEQDAAREAWRWLQDLPEGASNEDAAKMTQASE